MSKTGADIIINIIKAMLDPGSFTPDRDISETIKRSIRNVGNNAAISESKSTERIEEQETKTNKLPNIGVEETLRETTIYGTENRNVKMTASANRDNPLRLDFKGESITKAFVYSEIFGDPRCRKRGRW